MLKTTTITAALVLTSFPAFSQNLAQQMRPYLIFLFFIFTVASSAGQSLPKETCSIMKTGTFKYLESSDSTAYFVITDSSHTEYFGNGRYYIKSERTWISDCRFTLRMLSSTIPDFPFKPGDVMLVSINKTEGDIIYYTSEVNGKKWETSVRKLK